MDLRELKRQRFAESPELKREYEKLKLEESIVRQVIALRKKKNITQRELAELLHTKQPSIARFERGDAAPSLEFLKKITDVLDSYIDIRIIEKAG